MTAVLPASVSEVDRLRRENTNLRRMISELIDLLVFFATANRTGTPREIQAAARRARDTYTRVALHAIARHATKEPR